MSLAMNLQEKQRAAIIRMLNLNNGRSSKNESSLMTSLADEGEEDWGEEWKVLIYDLHCRDIISPLFNVGSLRKQGVTLHMLLDSAREAISDVPAVYFVSADEAAIELLAADAAKNLYSGMHLNFCSKLSRTLMEDLARKTLASRSVHNISKVYDQYLDFVTLEPNVFSIGFPECYRLYSSPSTPDREIEAAMRRVAFGLFSVVATLGVVPIIRAAPGGPGEMVARQLHSMISDHLGSPTTPFFRSQSHSNQESLSALVRPLLVLMDRNADLVTPLHHNSTYQALVDDTLSHHLNRVKFTTEGKEKSYDLDKSADRFFKEYAGKPFPEAIEANGKELQEVSAKEAELRSKASPTGEENSDVSAPPASQKSGEDLLSTIDSLPQILERKKALEAHTNILQAVMSKVAEREIPHFFELEQEMVSTQRADKAKLAALLSAKDKGTIRDKLRVLGVYLLATDASSTDLEEMKGKLNEAYPEDPAQPELVDGIKAIEYLRRQRSLQHLPVGGQVDAQPETKNREANTGAFLSFIGTQATGLLTKARDQVANLLVRNKKVYLSRVVENLCEQKPGSEDDTYLYLDPKAKKLDPLVAKASRGAASFQQVIAFVIGGGCYSEYQNLQDLAAPSNVSARQIIYGCTELQNAETFLMQLESLSK